MRLARELPEPACFARPRHPLPGSLTQKHGEHWPKADFPSMQVHRAAPGDLFF
jgi:hypothetical protein